MIYDGCGDRLEISSRAISIAESSAENIDKNDGTRYEIVKEDEKTAQPTVKLTLEPSVKIQIESERVSIKDFSINLMIKREVQFFTEI